MAIHSYSSSCADEDYIDIELFSSPNFFCYSISSPSPSTSPSPTKDFEFPMCPFPLDNEIYPKTSPADELFYKGKLLPLHIPPRLQMLQKFTALRSLDTSSLLDYDIYPFPTEVSVVNPTEISVGNPRVKPDDRNFIQFSAELHSFSSYHPLKKRNWTYKLKRSLLAQKIKASTVYLKSLFTKSGDEFSSTKAAASAASSTVQPKQAASNSTGDDSFDNLRYLKVSNISPFKVHEDSSTKRKSKALISSSSLNSASSNNSSTSSRDLQLLKRRSSSAINDCEIGISIEGAIAYCKKNLTSSFCVELMLMKSIHCLFQQLSLADIIRTCKWLLSLQY